MKRALDIILGISLLICLLPLMLFIAFLVKLFLGSPVLFIQESAGLGGKRFFMFKFRTMREAFDADNNLLPDDLRHTKFGRILRSSSLDELPELWNVIKGDMSLVGPRPLLIEYLPLYTKEQFRRHDTKPGITGLTQVSGRNHLKWEDKFKLDVWYVDNQSIFLDLKIIWKTIFTVITRSGINQKGLETMQKFKGTED